MAAARNEDALKELTDELKEKGHDAIWVKADVGKEEDVNRIAETAISTFGRFDTWVNNAVVSTFGHAMDVTVEDMKRMFDTNFWGPVYGTRAAVKHYTGRGVPGALINVGSLFGDRERSFNPHMHLPNLRFTAGRKASEWSSKRNRRPSR